MSLVQKAIDDAIVLVRDATRYRWLRRRNVAEFQDLFRSNIEDGIPFDELVDEAMREEQER